MIEKLFIMVGQKCKKTCYQFQKVCNNLYISISYISSVTVLFYSNLILIHCNIKISPLQKVV